MKRLNFNFRTMDQRQNALLAAMIGLIAGLMLTNLEAMFPLLIMAASLAIAFSFIVASVIWIGTGDSE